MKPLKYYLLLLTLVIFLAPANLSAQSKQPVDYVNPFTGTSTSRWMIFPGAAMPSGMVKLSPDNQETQWKAGYEYSIHNIAGFSYLHSWTTAGLLTMPTTGPLQIKPGPEDAPDQGYRSRFSHKREKASPGYYSVFLWDDGIKAELTATTRAGFQRFTFPKAEEARILFDLQFPTEYGIHVIDARVKKVNNREIVGYVKTQSTDWNVYTLHFVAQVNEPFESLGGWKEEKILRDIDKIQGSGDMGVFMNFTTTRDEEILLRVGISLVSIENARMNLQQEVVKPFGWDFDTVRQHALKTWNQLLSKIEVKGGSEKNKVKFYTNLYRSYSARTIFSDVNGEYVGPCEKVQQAKTPVYGADAFWNTFWNLNQLWTLVTPDYANEWVRSFIEMYRVSGWLPKGPAGIEYSGIMVASHEIPLMVSAYQKGIRNYDVSTMYQAIKHNQMVPGHPYKCGGRVGNQNLKSYLKLGYVPYEVGPISNTVEYAYDDWTVAQLAKALGKKQDYKTFTQRATYWKNAYDTTINYVRPRSADGTWRGDYGGFNAFSGQDFVEGNSWQYTWFVPQNVQGLINLMGRNVFNDRLNTGFMLSAKTDFSPMAFVDSETPEYKAMAFIPVNHGNQPNMQAAYLFNYSGKPWLTQKWARAIMDQYYGVGPINGWLGDEDQGQMGAWYVMSAMGLFEMRGGAAVKPIYEIGSPIFEKVIIHLNEKYYEGEKFVIVAKNVSEENKYIQSATLDGEPLGKPWFYHKQLVDGGKLVLVMGPEPNKDWGSDPADAPPSMSDPQH